MSFFGYLRILRPANIVTAHADILAGWAGTGFAYPLHLGELLLATTGLYAGGVVLNDVFDAGIDSIERPERPIPSGLISKSAGARLGAGLLALGIGAAFLCSPLSGFIAMATAAAAVIYDAVGKHHSVLGPINMGLCRGLNLLLGLSAVSPIPLDRAPLALVTLCYIAGVTALSRGEVKGGTRTAAAISGGWLSVALAAFVFLVLRGSGRLLFALPFVALLLWRLADPFWKAFSTLQPFAIRNAVKTAILSLIILDAGLAGLFGGVSFGLAVLALYIPATVLAKLFAVT